MPSSTSTAARSVMPAHDRAVQLSRVDVTLGGRRVLDGVSATFESDVIHVVRGPSGAGKSTLLNVAAGYVQPDTGEVTRPTSLRYLLQEETLFPPLTVRQNLAIMWVTSGSGLEFPEDTAREHLRSFGVESLLDEPVERLSGGERRRVETAGLLLHRPALLLLDEPTANLDVANAGHVQDGLWRHRHGRVTIVVSHDVTSRWPDEGPAHWLLNEGKLHRVA